MKAEYDALRDYVDAAVKAAWGYDVNPDQPQRKVSKNYATAIFMGVEIANVNSVFDEAGFSWDVFGFHDSPDDGSIDDRVMERGSALRFALLAETSPAQTGNVPMVTEHVREPDMEKELDGAFVTRTRFTVGAWVPRQPV